jgi:hypothetical protein
MNENENPSRAIRKSTLAEQGQENDLAGTTVDERIAMMWQLAVDAWAMMGVDVRESEFPRHVGRVVRRKR